jgi:hypothetical protein
MTPTPGAIRAGKEIAEHFREYLPNLDPSVGHDLAIIIDHEMGTTEMLETLEKLTEQLRGLADEIERVTRKARS